MTIRMSLILLATAGATQAAVANNIHVCPTCAHTTIQSAVNDAVSNDLITIAAGRYTENVTIEGKSLTLQGAAGGLSGVTEVYAAGRGPVFTLGTGVAGATPELIEMHSLTIAGGNHTGGTGAGGGVQVRAGSYLHLYDSTVTQNVATKGAGVAVDSPGSPVSLISGCVITKNLSNGAKATGGGPGGGVMVLAGSSATIRTSVITGNTSTDGGGVFADVHTQLTVTDSNISNNVSQPFSTPFGPTSGGGGGLESSGGFTISGTTLNNNLALGPTGGGGVYLSMNSGGAHVISNSMIARNNLFTPDNPFAEGIGAGLVANNTDPVQQTLTLNSDYIVENLQFGGLWIEGVALSLTNTTVKDNIGGQICSSAEGTCTP